MTVQSIFRNKHFGHPMSRKNKRKNSQKFGKETLQESSYVFWAYEFHSRTNLPPPKNRPLIIFNSTSSSLCEKWSRTKFTLFQKFLRLQLKKVMSSHACSIRSLFISFTGLSHRKLSLFLHSKTTRHRRISEKYGYCGNSKTPQMCWNGTISLSDRAKLNITCPYMCRWGAF